MRLTFRRYSTGELRPYWYGIFERGGKTRVATLCRWKGHPPVSGKVGDTGDPAFEASRATALAELREAVEGERSKADAASLSARIHRARYGRDVETVLLAELPQRWEAIPRRRQPCARYAENCRQMLGRFLTFMTATAPNIKELGACTGEHVRAFMASREKAEISGKTYNVELSLLRSMFKRLDQFS